MTPPSGCHFFQMTTGWRCHPVVNFFSNDNRMEGPSSSHFQIKMITGWNSSSSHSPNRTGWHPYPVVIWKKTNNRMTPPSGCHLNKNDNRMTCSSDCQFFSNDNRMKLSSSYHIRIIAVWNFFIKVQKEPIKVQEERTRLFLLQIY